MADILVVRSAGPSAKTFPLGKKLPDNERIVLQANDQLTLLDGRGTRELRGPGTFVAASASTVPARLDMMNVFATTTGRRARIGAIRNPKEETVRPPTMWSVDISKSGNVCVSPPNKVILWRADVTADTLLTVTGASGTRRIAWPAGDATVPWPEDLPVTDGAQYRLSLPAEAAPATIRFRTLPHPAGLVATASMLIDRQCTAQLDLLIETTRVPG